MKIHTPFLMAHADSLSVQALSNETDAKKIPETRNDLHQATSLPKETCKEQAAAVKEIELVDIEDIVPYGGNSLFLSCARALIYMYKKKSHVCDCAESLLGYQPLGC